MCWCARWACRLPRRHRACFLPRREPHWSGSRADANLSLRRKLWFSWSRHCGIRVLSRQAPIWAGGKRFGSKQPWLGGTKGITCTDNAVLTCFSAIRLHGTMCNRVRRLSLLLTGGAMRILESQSNTATQTSPFRADLVPQRSRRRVLSIERKNSPAEVGLEESLSTALRASDAEFGQILQEVDEISKLLRTHRTDEKTIR